MNVGSSNNTMVKCDQLPNENLDQGKPQNDQEEGIDPDILDWQAHTAETGHNNYAEYHIDCFIEDIILANRVTNSGLPNKYRIRQPVKSNWNLELMNVLLAEYQDRDILEWIKFGFSISRADGAPDLVLVDRNHMGATLYPEVIDAYVQKEVALGAAMEKKL